MSKKKVDFVFWLMRSKYCSWWAKRVEKPGLLVAERQLWDEALADYSLRQIKEAGFRCRERWQYRPPYAHEFTAFIDELANRPFDAVTGRRFDAPVKSASSRRFFSEIKNIIG